jgi:hypothetical protein
MEDPTVTHKRWGAFPSFRLEAFIAAIGRLANVRTLKSLSQG